jgi:hypothetical protein
MSSRIYPKAGAAERNRCQDRAHHVSKTLHNIIGQHTRNQVAMLLEL